MITEGNGKKIYIAGPMTGIRLYNYPAFDDAKKQFQGAGWLAISPADTIRLRGFRPESVPEPFNWWTRHHLLPPQREIVFWCLTDVQHVDAIVLFSGWPLSRGATAERAVALLRDIEIWEQSPATLDFELSIPGKKMYT